MLVPAVHYTTGESELPGMEAEHLGFLKISVGSPWQPGSRKLQTVFPSTVGRDSGVPREEGKGGPQAGSSVSRPASYQFST